MSESAIELHPESKALLAEIALLGEELARLLADEHDLIHIVKPNLFALYQQKVGAWELQRLQAQVAMLRTKRMLELAQAAVNRGRTPDWTAIDGHLELEFVAWQQRIKEAAGQVTAAGHLLKNLLPPEDARELKKLYHALVKRLHPDLNPKLTEDQRRLWLRVQSAYESGDIGELRALALLVDQRVPAAVTPAALDALRRDRDALQKQVAEMPRRIEAIESQPPFTLRAQLSDEAWVAARRQELETGIAHFDAPRAALDAPLQALMKSSDDGKIFGPN